MAARGRDRRRTADRGGLYHQRPPAFKALIDRVIQPRDTRLLVPILSLLAAGMISAVLAGLIRDYAYARVLSAFLSDLRRDMFRHLLLWTPGQRQLGDQARSPPGSRPIWQQWSTHCWPPCHGRACRRSKRCCASCSCSCSTGGSRCWRCWCSPWRWRGRGFLRGGRPLPVTPGSRTNRASSARCMKALAHKPRSKRLAWKPGCSSNSANVFGPWSAAARERRFWARWWNARPASAS